MYIDPKIQFPNDAQPDQVPGTRNAASPTGSTAKGAPVSSTSDGDTVSLSTTHSEIQSLAANLQNVPEVRTDRVQSLRALVSQGQYQPSSQSVAEAIVREYSRVSL
jgi:flagellar biosynthesis anti-sigma factor FlgM